MTDVVLLVSRSRASILRLKRKTRSDLERVYWSGDSLPIKPHRPQSEANKAALRLESVSRVSALDTGRELGGRQAATQLVHFSILGGELRPARVQPGALSPITGSAVFAVRLHFCRRQALR